MIDVRTTQLAAFLVLTEELHFSRAASRLGVAQSGLSAQIRRLEESVGTPLLTRTSRRVALTPAGTELRDGARRMLVDLDDVVARAAAAAAGLIGRVRVSGMGAALVWLVPRTLAELHVHVAELAVEVVQMPSALQLDAVATGAIDVAFLRDARPRAGIELETLLLEPVQAVLPATHRLADRESVELAELAEEPFVLWSRAGAPAFHDRLVAACRHAGFDLRAAREVPGNAARQAFVGAGLGVALESRSYADACHRDVRFVPLQGDPVHATIQLAWRRSASNPATDHVLDAARSVASTG